MNLQLHSGYFSVKSPVKIIERWLNPYQLIDNIDIRGKNMAIMCSRRAVKALAQRQSALTAELQLYFTCVVQKRVIFHEKSDLDAISTNTNLNIFYRTVQSSACDPSEFAEKHPVEKDLNSKSASLMRPSVLKIDYKNGLWQGSFSF